MVDKVYLNEESMPLKFQFCKLRAVAPHYHEDQIVIMIVLRGKVKLHAGSLHRKLGEGEMAFINAGEVYYTEKEIENEIMVVHIKTNDKIYKKSCAFSKSECTGLKLNIMALANIYYMNELVEEDLYIKACQKILKIIDDIFAVSVRSLVEYINIDFQRRLTVADVENATGMNGRSVTAALKREEFGCFLDCLNYVRCTAADRMLLGSKIKVNEIATRNGFSSVRSFIRDFTAYSGRTPLQQRKFYKEISKHKFNRIVELPQHYTLQEIRRYVGDLYISMWMEKVSNS